MIRIATLALLPILLFASATAPPPLNPPPPPSPAYAFAQNFAREELLGNQSARDAFMTLMFTWEGQFHIDGVGVDMLTGMTFDGTAIHPDTLLPQVMAAQLRGMRACMLTLTRAAGQRAPQLQRSQQGGAAPHPARPCS